MQKSFWMLTLMRVSMALLDVDFSSRGKIDHLLFCALLFPEVWTHMAAN